MCNDALIDDNQRKLQAKALWERIFTSHGMTNFHRTKTACQLLPETGRMMMTCDIISLCMTSTRETRPPPPSDHLINCKTVTGGLLFAAGTLTCAHPIGLRHSNTSLQCIDVMAALMGKPVGPSVSPNTSPTVTKRLRASAPRACPGCRHQ